MLANHLKTSVRRFACNASNTVTSNKMIASSQCLANVYSNSSSSNSSSRHSYRSRRCFSDVPTPPSDSTGSINNSIIEGISNNVDTVINTIAVTPQLSSTSPSHIVMSIMDSVSTMAGVPYWEAIVMVTLGLRLILLPVAIKTAQAGARLAVARPEIQKISDVMKLDPNQSDPKIAMKYQLEMKAVFSKYQVNPIQTLIMPLLQLPIFISFFIGLQSMGIYFPEYATGGDYWFVDLSAADATYAFPIINSISFLIMGEIGSGDVQSEHKNIMKNVLRGVGVLMIPLTLSIPQGVHVYWVANNTLSIVQGLALKNQGVKDYFNIPKPPVDLPGANLKIRSPISALQEALKKDRPMGDKDKAEIIDATIIPPPPPPSTDKPDKPKLYSHPVRKNANSNK